MLAPKLKINRIAGRNKIINTKFLSAFRESKIRNKPKLIKLYGKSIFNISFKANY